MVPTDEAHVAEAIDTATQEMAGNAKGISNVPLTLLIKKNGVPDLCDASVSEINKSIVGIPTLAQNLVHIQAMIISKCLPKL